MAFRLPYWEEGRTGLWHPAFPQYGMVEQAGDDLQELFWWIMGDGVIEAHNSWFERGIWTNIMTPRYGWPAIPHRSWRCSAAKAAAYALPRALDAAGAALNLSVLKDDEGSKVMKKLMKPRKARKKERENWPKKYGDRPMPLLYHESADLFHILFRYCRQDVLAEEAVSSALDDLTPMETEVFLLNEEMNERGFQLDMRAVDRALTVIEEDTTRLNAELCELTGGSPSKATQRTKMLEWFESKGLKLYDTQKGTIQEAITADDSFDESAEVDEDDELPPWVEPQTALAPEVRRGLEILQQLGLSSTAKFVKMREWACPADGRARGGILYHGATTGRFSGAGIQPHNFPKGFLKEEKHPMTAIWVDILTLDKAQVEAKYGCSMLKLLSHALRGAITARNGRHLFVADYASIEVRVLLWLAEDEAHLDMLRKGVDMYVDMASKIYNRRLTKEDKTERGLGKVAVLGLGYQMGASKFVDSAKLMAGVEITEEFSKTVVDTYRAEYWRVKSLWYDCEEAAIAAVENPGEPQSAGRVVYVVEDSRFLFCYLPSGRRLSYPFPEIQERKTPWGAVKNALTYMGVDQYTRKWRRQVSYGGMLVENAVQAVARDLMAQALLNVAHTRVYEPVLSIHDEVVCEAHPLLGDLREFERLLTQVPEWAEGCPIAVESWNGPRYRKG
jgi:DNA polymerase